MNAEERDLILDLFDRIGAASTQDNDREAELLIRDAVARNPNAPYVLVQTALLQEEALRRADERIRQLENSRAQANAEPRPRSFLGAGPALDLGSVPVTGKRQRPETPAGGRDDDPRRQNSGWSSGSFLSNALSTAGGVAGGMLLADSIRGLFGGEQSGDLFGKPAEASTSAENKGVAEKPTADDAVQDSAQDAEYDQEYDWDDGDTFDI